MSFIVIVYFPGVHVHLFVGMKPAVVFVYILTCLSLSNPHYSPPV